MAGITLEHIAQLADRLSAEDKLSLVEHLAKSLRQEQSQPVEVKKPQDLYGVWREHFPEDFDIDAALYEIRHEWEKEWPEVFKK